MTSAPTLLCSFAIATASALIYIHTEGAAHTLSSRRRRLQQPHSAHAGDREAAPPFTPRPPHLCRRLQAHRSTRAEARGHTRTPPKLSRSDLFAIVDMSNPSYGAPPAPNGIPLQQQQQQGHPYSQDHLQQHQQPQQHQHHGHDHSHNDRNTSAGADDGSGKPKKTRKRRGCGIDRPTDLAPTSAIWLTAHSACPSHRADKLRRMPSQEAEVQQGGAVRQVHQAGKQRILPDHAGRRGEGGECR